MSDQRTEELPGELESRRSHWRRIVVAGVLLPLVAASLLIWSATGREDHIDKVPVAIVNNDTIITDPQPMAAGRLQRFECFPGWRRLGDGGPMRYLNSHEHPDSRPALPP